MNVPERQDDLPILVNPRVWKWTAILFGMWLVTDIAARWAALSIGDLAITNSVVVVLGFTVIAIVEADDGKANFGDMWRAALVVAALGVLVSVAFEPFNLLRAVASFLFVYLLSGVGFFLGSSYLRLKDHIRLRGRL